LDLSSLAELGKVAGVAGIAIGLIALLAPQIIKSASTPPRAEQGPMLRLIAIGAFAIGALGIVAWLIAGVQMGTSVATGNCGIATNGAATGNTVNCGSPPPAQPKQP
jgi:O-antigen/teichoic acid export membrane protein